MRRTRSILLSVFLLLALPVAARAAVLTPGDIVVADPNGYRVVSVGAVGGSITTLVAGSASHGVAFDAAGNLFATRYYDQRVDRVDVAAGTYVPLAGGALLQGVIGLGCGPDGMLYATSNVPRILRIDPSSGAVSILTSGGLLSNPQGVAFTPAGDMLVANYNSSILRVNLTTGAQSTAYSGGLLAGAVSGVAVGSDGTVYATEIVNSRVVRIDPVTGAQTLLTSYGAVSSPRGLVVDGGNVYVCSQENGALARFVLPSGPAGQLTPGYGLSLPYNAAITPTGPTPAAGTSWGRLKSLFR